MASGLCLGLLVVSELPVNDDTMVLRLFGRGHHQQRALKELFDRKEGDRTLEALWALVMRWRIAVENKQQDSRTDLDDEFIDNIAWLKEYERQQRETAIAEGHAEGHAEGRAEGRAEGHAEGHVESKTEEREELLDLVILSRLGRWPVKPYSTP